MHVYVCMYTLHNSVTILLLLLLGTNPAWHCYVAHKLKIPIQRRRQHSRYFIEAYMIYTICITESEIRRESIQKRDIKKLNLIPILFQETNSSTDPATWEKTTISSTT